MSEVAQVGVSDRGPLVSSSSLSSIHPHMFVNRIFVCVV